MLFAGFPLGIVLTYPFADMLGWSNYLFYYVIGFVLALFLTKLILSLFDEDLF